MLPPTYNAIYFDEIDSTNEALMRLYSEGKIAPNTVIYAGAQSAGRGSRGRVWHSPIGNLYMSLLLAIEEDTTIQPMFSLLTAVAVQEALQQVYEASLPIAFKWPNDILLQGRKVSGILLESVKEKPGSVIVGIGVNLVTHPEQASYPATDFLVEGFMRKTPQSVMEAVVKSIDHWLAIWKSGNREPICQAWLAHAHGLNSAISVDDGVSVQRGSFAGIAANGALLLRKENSTIESIISGTVRYSDAPGHVRAASF
ncbi:MAG: biotin--[acetyl-CoA-carboxylase] ligase [Dongiaceae bacterium]